METEFEYSAFISYKREDEKWAIWLQNRLERYSIPSSLRKEIPRLPKHIKPVFRDKTDLGAGGLVVSLHKELERSHFLIVICSPYSANSDWVGQEIEYFRGLGREEQIIPFIVDGVPHCEDTSQECFHPIFKQFSDEPLGINIKEIGKQQALVKVLAKLLDLRYDVLWGRHQRYLRQKRIKIVSVFLLIACLGLLYWYYTKPMYKYYADYVDRWGIPEGVIELDKSMVKHRYRSYRFEYRRIPIGEHNAFSWRLSKVEYVNSADKPQDYYEGEMRDRYAIMKIEYNSSSETIKHIDFCNKNGKLLLRWKVSSKDGVKAALIDFLGTTDIDASGYLGASTTVSHDPSEIINKNKSSIKRYVLERDKQGYIVSKCYHSSNADNIELSKTADVNGVYKQEFINDSLGRVLTTKFYDVKDNILNLGNGVAIRKNRYDLWGNYSQTESFDSDTIPVLDEQLCAKITTACDQWGNIVEKRYYGIDGNLCFSKDNIACEVIDFDDNGFPLSVSYYDDNLLSCKHREGYAKLIIKCDSRGNQIENRFEDMSGKPCANRDGISKISVEYDRWGNPVYMANYGINGGLTRNGEGVAGYNSNYDRFGNRIQVEFFDEGWNICSNNMGFAALKTDYEARGFPEQYAFFDVKGEKTLCNNGFASVKYHYNERGNPDVIAYFDVDGSPCLNNGGFHKVRNIYDGFGNLIEIQYSDISGNLCLSNECFAFCKIFPDSLGNVRQWICYDILGRPIKDVNGVCAYRWKYDRNGRPTNVRYFDEEGKLTENLSGVAGWDAKYDSRGNQIECINVGINGSICCDSFGVARWVKEFDKRNNQLLYSAYNVNNQLVSHQNGIAFWKSEFNDRGLVVKTAYFDENGNYCMNTDVGYSRYETKYNNNLDQVEICTYDEKGNLCVDPMQGFAKWIAKYDENGNKIEMLSFSEMGSLCVCKNGYARWTAKYDKKGDMTESCSFDEKGVVIPSHNDNMIKTEKDIRKYDSHRFEYDMADVIFGFLFLALLTIVLWFWLKNIMSNSITQNFLCLAGVIALMGFDYCYLRRFLLHYNLVPYSFYNFTWVLCLVSSLCCFAAASFMLYLLGSRIVLILKTDKYYKKSQIKESKEMLIVFPIVIAWLAYVTYYILVEGWIIYSNPL